MKYIILPLRKEIVFFTFSVLCFSFLLSSCTKTFEERNTDPSRISELSPADLQNLFPTALYAGMNAGDVNGVDYQRPQNLFADDYAQYYGSTQTAFASDRYNIIQAWVLFQWFSTYIASLPATVTIINSATTPETVTMRSIARIWKVFVLHRTTDYWGPIPYFNIGSDSTVIPYDSQKDIYYDFFKELKEATNDLKSNIDVPSFGGGDMIYNGDNSKWLAFGNSLRLRLALRISYVDPDKAKEEAEAAVKDGVMTDISQDAYLAVSAPHNFNGLARISDWNEFRMSATMESLLVGYNDPRLSEYFEPAEATGLFKGVRNGMIPAEQTMPENDYLHASNLNPRLRSDNMFTTPQTVMYSAESYFLRAEGAVNGWDMQGDAEDLYNKGIENSMRTWGITNTGVINDYAVGTSLPIAPGGYFNTPALTDIPVKFSSNEDIQREQIGTQKWIAVFPDGMEAWAEMRRTGFPKRYPLIHSDNNDVPKDKMIRRIPFLEFDRNKNAQAVDDAVNLLKGPDNAATPVWWDIH